MIFRAALGWGINPLSSKLLCGISILFRTTSKLKNWFSSSLNSLQGHRCFWGWVDSASGVLSLRVRTTCSCTLLDLQSLLRPAPSIPGLAQPNGEVEQTAVSHGQLGYMITWQTTTMFNTHQTLEGKQKLFPGGYRYLSTKTLLNKSRDLCCDSFLRA